MFIRLVLLSSVIVKLTVLGSLCLKDPSGYAGLLLAHTPSSTIKHSEQAGRMEFQNDRVAPDPQQMTKSNKLGLNPAALCAGLYYIYFIRLLALVTI